VGAGDGWIDTTRGRTHEEEDDLESSTYFQNQAAQGQKRKKAPFFKYSKKRKGYGNASSSSKGCVEFVHISVSRWRTWLTINLNCLLSPPLLLSCVVAAAAAATIAISRGHHPAPEVVHKVQVVGPGAQREGLQQADDQDSWQLQCLKAASGPS